MFRYNSRAQYYAIRKKSQLKCLDIPTTAGIYLWTRNDGEFTYFYVGQAKNLQERRTDYQMIIDNTKSPIRHFEASLKTHPDWKFEIIEQDLLEYQLNERERYWIKQCISKGWVTRNEMSGGGKDTKRIGSDIVHSNYKRIKRIEQKYYDKLKSFKNYLDINWTENQIIFKTKLKKDGSPTAMGRKKIVEILELFDIINNEKQRKE